MRTVRIYLPGCCSMIPHCNRHETVLRYKLSLVGFCTWSESRRTEWRICVSKKIKQFTKRFKSRNYNASEDGNRNVINA